MNNEEINTDSNIDGDNNSVNNTINSYNKIVINNYSTGDIYQIFRSCNDSFERFL